MTKKEFKEALLRGRGRCLQAVLTNPEKYRDLVLWACTHNLSFDTQCEGTRAWFVYQLAFYYDDVTPFINAAATALQSCRSDSGWRMSHLSELLWFFAEDGNIAARNALWRKYQQLYDYLLARKRPKNGLFPERDDFHHLCVTLGVDKNTVLKIAEDLGKLYQQRSFYDGLDFDWFYGSRCKPYLPSLKKAARTSDAIAAFLEAQESLEQAFQAPRITPPDSGKTGVLLSLWLKHKADPDTISQYVKAYEDELIPAKRAEALKAFCRCPYPNNPSPIIADAQSDCEELKAAAWEALKNIRHPLVREFAFAHLNTSKSAALLTLIQNYEPKDAKLLEALVKSIPTDHDDTSGWHGIYSSILAMSHEELKPTPGLLYHIYENTYCSYCRNNALRAMGRRRLLTREILQECLYDSDDEIRAYARKHLKSK